MKKYEEALKILKNTVLWLANHNESAANSLREGMHELLTVHRLKMPTTLRSTFSTTNPIESMFDKVKYRSRNVKNWHAKSQAPRWCASSLLLHEKKFRTIKGYREIPILIQNFKPLAQQLDSERKAA